MRDHESIEAEFDHLRERILDRGFQVESQCCGNPPAVRIWVSDADREISFCFFRMYESFCEPEQVESRVKMIADWFRFVIRRIDQIDAAEEFGR